MEYINQKDLEYSKILVKLVNIPLSTGSTTYKLADMGTAKQYTDDGSDGNSANQLVSIAG